MEELKCTHKGCRKPQTANCEFCEEHAPGTEIALKETEKAGMAEQKSVENMISLAIKEKTPIETMEKLLAMRRELKAEFAKQKFDEAMAGFQSECPIIKKQKAGGKTNSGVVAYYYATLGNIIKQTKELLTKYGLSYSFKTETRIDGVKAICIAKHKYGHSESSEIDLPLGAKTNVMSQPQLVAAATTFAKRYAFSNVFGIVTEDEDNEDNLKSGDRGSKVVALLKIISKASLKNLDEMAEKMEKNKSKYGEEELSQFYCAIEERREQITAPKS